MRTRQFRFISLQFVLCLAVVAGARLLRAQMNDPAFSDVSVHDPSVVRVDGTFYIFGSHLASARSDDLMNWAQVSSNPNPNNPLVPDPYEELSEAIEWSSIDGQGAAFWAPDAVELGDGRFYFYYCTGNLGGPTGYMGLAVADNIEGPYENRGLIRRSGESGFNANLHPNAVDPHTFFDKDGDLWTVYGSYSGGIFILRMDPGTGMPPTGRGETDQGWGTKLTGGYHARIEGPYILYSPESDYYYLFLSFGGLGAGDGYNIRVARSRNPDGPYYDSSGKDMRDVSGTPGTLFDDDAIEPYGVKLMGDHRFLHVDGEPRDTSTGYRSPGHNSAYYDSETGKHYLIFHTRFVGSGNFHRVRVHQMYLNEDDWLVAAPHRYAGELPGRHTTDGVAGEYKIINHGRNITGEVRESVVVRLRADGSITDLSAGRNPEIFGSWELGDGRYVTLTFDGVEYRGVFNTQWDDDNRVWIPAFTALSDDGSAFWGSRVASDPLSPLELWRYDHFSQTGAEGLAGDEADPNGSGLPNLVEYALGRNPVTRNADPPWEVGFETSGSRLALAFERITDSALTYAVEAASHPAGPWTRIWSSSGSENVEGPVTVPDTFEVSENPARFLRLNVARE